MIKKVTPKYETDREYLIISLMFQAKKQMLKQKIKINATKIDDSLDFALIKGTLPNNKTITVRLESANLNENDDYVNYMDDEGLLESNIQYDEGLTMDDYESYQYGIDLTKRGYGIHETDPYQLELKNNFYAIATPFHYENQADSKKYHFYILSKAEIKKQINELTKFYRLHYKFDNDELEFLKENPYLNHFILKADTFVSKNNYNNWAKIVK